MIRDPMAQKEPVVLVVDDDNTIRMLTRAALEQAGFKVEEAADGIEALSVCEKVRPDMVLLDILMPGKDGFIVCTELRQRPECALTPIIMMTALEDLDSINLAYNLGATDFITKPINWTILCHRLRYILRATQEAMVRKHMEEQLYQSQKMEAVGRLAGSVAHDFNNVLTVILGHVDILLMSLEDNHDLYQQAEEIRQGVELATSITRQLLVFSRKKPIQPTHINLNKLVEQQTKMLRRLMGKDIDLLTALNPETGNVLADPGQMEQVIMNLVINARDAMPRGGRLTIETTPVYLDDGFCKQHVGITPGPYIMLAVSDTGTGIDPEIREHIFEPFFTTKGPEKGTGLGLFSVFGIIKQINGHISVQSEPNLGTTLKIYLPNAGRTVDDLDLDQRQTNLYDLQGNETILLVKEDDSGRHELKTFLQKIGYTVLEAGNPSGVLSLLQQCPKPVHLLLTDVVLPKMSGIELAKKIAKSHPEVKVLYMSDYMQPTTNTSFLEQSAHFIHKPCSSKTLAVKIREILS